MEARLFPAFVSESDVNTSPTDLYLRLNVIRSLNLVFGCVKLTSLGKCKKTTTEKLIIKQREEPRIGIKNFHFLTTVSDNVKVSAFGGGSNIFLR